MDPHSVGRVTPQSVQVATEADPLVLESGETLGPVDVAYEAYGTPDADRSNAILICHALSGDAHAAGFHGTHDKRTGWWDAMIGPGKAFDTRRYWVICSNIIGGCKGSTGPGSENPATGRPYGADFPIITIGDMVDVQKRLVEHLGIRRLLCVAGGSMGGFQVLEWTLRYPEAVDTAVCIAAAPRLSARPGSVTNRRTALPRAGMSPGGTTSPAPSSIRGRSETAVATTGLAMAMAS